MPSIFTAQKNMHMVELNSAAEQIALATQNKMTSMKVSGTWLSEIESVTTEAHKAKHLPSDSGVTDAADIFFMSAHEARSLGILTNLSLEESVYSGSYVIEFSKSTATVCGVFYSDGKNGFFDAPAEAGTPAETYYAEMISESERNQSARADASPLVGYYWGTPAGATKAIALAKPNIWIDDMGKLCIQNPNLNDESTKNSSIEITIRHEPNGNPAQKIILSDLQKITSSVGDQTGGTYSLGIDESTLKTGIVNSDDQAVYEIFSRDSVLAVPDAFKIDLERVIKVLNGQGDAQKEVAESFAAGVDISIEAKAVLKNKTNVPGVSKAFMQWPKNVEKLTILVTGVDESIAEYGPPNGTHYNYSLATKRDGNGSKTEFVPVSLMTRELKPPVQKFAKDDFSESIPIKGTPEDLKSQDPGAAAQYYKGKQLSSQEVDETVLFEITPGNVMKRTNSIKYYYYQIYEIWVNDTLIGSVQGVTWKWAAGLTAEKTKGLLLEKTNNGTQPIEEAMPTFSADNPSIYLDPTKLKESGIPIDGEDCTVYIRSAPAIKDVEHYLNDNVGNTPGNASSRSTDGLSYSWRYSFLGSFRAPTSIALWSIKMGRIPGISASAENDICFYYAPTPFAKGKESFSGVPLPSSVMWALKTTSEYFGSTYGLYYDYLAVGQDYSKVVPPPAGLGEVARPQVDPLGSADFAIRTDTPELYYRSITYYEAAEKPYPNIPAQWEPIVGFNVVEGKPVTNADVKFPNAPEKTDYAFVGWTQESDGSGQRFPAGALLSDYRNSLPLGAVKLYAQYVKSGIGLMYLEFDKSERDYYDPAFGKEGFDKATFNAEKKIIGWRGYYSANQRDKIGALATDGQTIGSFGYYVVVPTGSQKPTTTGGTYQDNNLFIEKEGIEIDGSGPYDLYRIGGYGGIGSSVPEGHVEMRNGNRKITYSNSFLGKKYQATYTFNLNFADALVREGNSTAINKIDGTVASPSSWGEQESPWKVRQAMQYPGALSNNNNPNPQDVYKGSFFKQEHDLDMMDTSRFNGYSSNYKYVFTGVYDGSNYKIKNVHARFTEHNQNTVEKSFLINGSNVRAWGLFPATQNATIKNVRIVETPLYDEKTSWSVIGAFDFNFGMLVGYAQDTSIENCSVSTEQFEASPPTVRMVTNDSQIGGSPSAGGLVGRAEGTRVLNDGYSAMRIVNCTFQQINIDIAYSRSPVSKQPFMGGLVGRASGIAIQEKHADHGSTVLGSTLKVLSRGSTPANDSMSFGAVVGRVEDTGLIKTSLSTCSVKNVELRAPERPIDGKETAVFGAFIGWYTGLGDPVSGDSICTSITSQYGSEAAVSVTNNIGRQD